MTLKKRCFQWFQHNSVCSVIRRSWTTKRTKGHEMRERLFVAFAFFRGLRDPNHWGLKH